MKNILLLVGLVVLLADFSNSALADAIDKENCSFKGIPLYGNVKVVDSAADISVQQVETDADLDITKSDAPSKCGQWHFVNVNEKSDFTIEYVEDGADIKVRNVDIKPGVNQQYEKQ